jgi:hypothetical protein
MEKKINKEREIFPFTSIVGQEEMCELEKNIIKNL